MKMNTSQIIDQFMFLLIQNIEDNGFSGPIPSELGNLESSTALWLSE